MSFALFAQKVLGLSITPPGCQRRGDFRCYQPSPLLLSARWPLGKNMEDVDNVDNAKNVENCGNCPSSSHSQVPAEKSGSPSGLACSMQSFWPWPIFAGWLGPMQFWSENHQVGWHAAEYLIGDQKAFYHSSFFLSSHLGAAKLWINTQCDRVSIFKSTRIGFNSFSRRSQWRGTRQGGCQTSS